MQDVVRQATERYNQLAHEVSNAHQRSSEMIDGRLGQVENQLELVQQALQQQGSLIDKERPQETVLNYAKTQEQRQQALSPLPSEIISCPQVSLVVPTETGGEI